MLAARSTNLEHETITPAGRSPLILEMREHREAQLLEPAVQTLNLASRSRPAARLERRAALRVSRPRMLPACAEQPERAHVMRPERLPPALPCNSRGAVLRPRPFPFVELRETVVAELRVRVGERERLATCPMPRCRCAGKPAASHPRRDASPSRAYPARRPAGQPAGRIVAGEVASGAHSATSARFTQPGPTGTTRSEW